MFVNSGYKLLLLLYLVDISLSLKILAITPHMGKSHQLVFEPLFKQLVSIGHQVTLITRFPMRLEYPNWKDINIAVEDKNETEILTFDILTGSRLDRYACPIVLMDAARIACTEGLSHPNLQTFLKEDRHFDLILIEIFNTNCFMGVAKKYNAPIIGIHSSIWMPWMYQSFGVPFNPSYLPSHFLGLPIPMNFIQRLENTINHLYSNLLYDYEMIKSSNTLSKKYVGVDLYENGDVTNDVNMLFINTHFTLNLPIPLTPNVIEIGGIHIDSQPIKKLPQEMEKFISEAKHGVIYMSMGSTIRGDTFPKSKQMIFLNVFSRLPQRVIWKWESEMENKPDNVMTTRWAPQKDILCHPNVKVFITHSGLLGTIESVYCGKPMLSLPHIGDQFTNAMSTEQAGGGLVFMVQEINEKILAEALKKLLSSEFTEKARSLSKRFKDRPMSPMNTALYWINYIVENKGAPYMKSAAVNMPTYQYLLLDVVAVLLILLFMSFYIFYRFVKITSKLCYGKRDKIKKSCWSFLMYLSSLTIFQNCVQCAKILGVFPMFGMSHHKLAVALMRGLAEAGNEVTIVCAYEDAYHPTNGSYRNIVLQGLAEAFKGPFNFVNRLVGNPTMISYTPQVISTFSRPMSFKNRLHNTILYTIEELMNHFLFIPRQDKLIKTYFEDAPSVTELNSKVSLVLVNSHETLWQPVPLVPNVIPIGGFHITPPKSLPKDLEAFLDSATDGAIFFSLGSNLKSIDLPKKTMDIFLKSFKNLKQKILWKLEGEVEGLPSNVKTGRWLPQMDILAHPNIRLFISHGGLLSMTEAIYHGVPILVIPVFGDQATNANNAVYGGFGLSVIYHSFTEEKFTYALGELLTNSKYKKNALKRSKAFHDRPIKPIDLAVYWVNYVIEHDGAPHLRVDGSDMPWYKYLLIDVILTLTIASICIVLVSYHVGKLLFNAYYKQVKVKKC
ncbi:UDP-glycosyltransferase UGT5-like [Diorhabda carinulata]|uniref:UDP-glycosyltransferase UGT5-like n=1 Tax=Diorhabda carinulata TaxID=1163345 RepID=UPI0025A1CEC6|nr:UDP-glycosyltransferase UGT5-like [Diorhabda carinulata]